MRVHRLEVTAFGPFAETSVVDFDDVTDSGLFLVHGPTGAGKTSLLDAVCFALYAGVPGARASGTSLRSHHAPDGAVPLVVLEFTAAGRRLRLARQPAFTRPGRATPVQAKVTLEEQRAGTWECLSTRSDEVGDIVLDVLGMGRQQFERVVLLPQGEFAAFLRSSADDRRKVLEKLFDVGTYADIETWLAEQRRALESDVSRGRERVTNLGEDLREVLVHAPVEAAEPQVGSIQDLVDSVVSGVLSADEVSARLGTVEREVDTAVTIAMATHDTAKGGHAVAQAAWLRAEATHEAQARGAAARRALVDLAVGAPDLVPLREALERDERARPCVAPLTSLDAARDRLLEAEAALRRGWSVVRDLRLPVARAGGRSGAEALGDGACDGASFEDGPPDPAALDDDALGAELAGLESHTSALTDAVAALQQRERAQRAGDELAAERAALESAQRTADEHLDAARGEVVAATRRLETARATRELVATVAAELETARSRVRYAERVAELSDSLEVLALAVREAVNRAQDARQLYQDRREARLAGMAAELATGLQPGCGCPVCGSTDHPSPATAQELVSADEVAEAELAFEEANRGREAAQREADETRAHLQAARDELGPGVTDTATLLAVRDELAARHAQARAVVGQESALRAALEAARAAVAQGEAARAERQARLDELTGQLATHRAQVADADRTLRVSLTRHARGCPCVAEKGEDLPDHPAAGEGLPAPDPDDLLVRHGRAREALGNLVTALRRHTVDAAAVATAEGTVASSIAAQGFPDEAEVRAAQLDDARRRELVRTVRDHEEASLKAQAVLEDETVVAALALPLADPDLARQSLETSVAERDRAAQVLTLAQRSQSDTRKLVTALTAATVDLLPRIERLGVLSEVALAAAGGGSNTMRMQLSAYVLAARLERVAQLANERLAVMGDGRFELRHTAERTGNAKAGLGLEVVDLWTGQTRGTATLSGGESFMASLALALGLADAVREEAGGNDLQTLFIDEGFGTLDDESLEQVLGVLDTLREGGRAVGVVSHVADLKVRITRQIEVRKTTRGSSLAVHGAA